jgi:hypothetical protein
MTAFCTSVELGRGFINSPGLYHPPVSFLISTLWTDFFSLGHGAQVFFFFAYNDDFLALLFAVYGPALFQRLFPSTFGANIASFLTVRLAKCSALWTKFQQISSISRIPPSSDVFKCYVKPLRLGLIF